MLPGPHAAAQLAPELLAVWMLLLLIAVELLLIYQTLGVIERLVRNIIQGKRPLLALVPPSEKAASERDRRRAP